MNSTQQGQGTVSDKPTGSAKPKRVRRVKEVRAAEYPQQQGRSKKKKDVKTTELAVQQLQWEMQQLEDRRRALTHGINTRESTVGVIGEFFLLFRYGLAGNAPAFVQKEQPSLETQLGFVASRFHQNVRSADGLGPSAFLDQIRRFSLVHDDVRLDLLRCVEVIAADEQTTVQFIKRLMLTVTEITIQYVFPHLLRPENQHIAKKMVGHQFTFFANAFFVFDEAGAVLEAEWTVDFVTGMLEVLTLEEVATVLQLAQISRDAYLTNGPPDSSEDRVASPPVREEQPLGTEVVTIVPKKMRATADRKREQWRRNQTRYRKQRLNTIGDLEVEVARVRMEILHLEAQRRSLRETVSTPVSSVRIVADLFHRLRAALATSNAPTLVETEPQSLLLQPQSHHQLIASTLYHDSLSSAKGYGFASFMDHMRRFALIQDGVQLELLRCEEVGKTETTTIVEVVKRIHFKVSDTAISHVFPRLELPQLSWLRNKLLGQQLSFLVTAFFVIDETGGVVDVQWAVDYATGLQVVLTLEETVAVLSQDPVVEDTHFMDTPTSETKDVAYNAPAEEDEDEEWMAPSHQFNGFRIPSNPQRRTNNATYA